MRSKRAARGLGTSGLVLGAAYISYAIAQALSYSGVLALFFAGIILAHYNWHNLSHSAKLVTGHICKSLGWLSFDFIKVKL